MKIKQRQRDYNLKIKKRKISLWTDPSTEMDVKFYYFIVFAFIICAKTTSKADTQREKSNLIQRNQPMDYIF